MRARFFSGLVTAAALAWMTVGMGGAAPDLLGFSPANSAVEMRWEAAFRAQPQPARLRSNMQILSADPHNAGSPRQRVLAQWILSQFQADGFNAHIEHFTALYPTPTARQVELVAPSHFAATLRELPVAGDPTPGQAGELPTFLMYSADGDVTASLVYVNYGLPADYATLARLGVSVRGRIVIARYGNAWRGLKPQWAYQHGAVGCLIYSDPQQDGYGQGAVYPNGPYRPAFGVQRGSVLEMTLHPGNPATPAAATLQKIPVLPLSYGDALPLLRALGGPIAPPGWQGALPIAYHVGPGAARVHLAVKFHWGLANLYDVIGVIPGRGEPDQWVIRGNHFDAWVNGADDPGSGQAALLEEARGLGLLLRRGWRPRRTIVYAAWDGEEAGLLGSTAWATAHAAELDRHAVAYLNTDLSEKGVLQLGGSQTLEHFLNGVARAVTDPETGQTLWARDAQAVPALPRDGSDLRVGSLGAGSDYSPFLQHLGIASVDMGFFGAGSGIGVYHSAYDDFYWYTHFGDTQFVYERALVQTMGTAVMRLADAQVLPFQFSDFADNLAADESQIEAVYRAQRGAPSFDFTPLRTAVMALRAAATDYDRASNAAAGHGARQPALNLLLAQSERKLLDPAGLPGRPWYRHQIYAPSLETGYGAQTLPGVRAALEDRNYPLAAREEIALARALAGFTARIRAAQADL